MEKTQDLWAFVRLVAIRKAELKKAIAWGYRNQNKWWWDDEQQHYHDQAIKELQELNNNK